MRKAISILAKCVLLLGMGGVVGIFLLTVVFCIPVNEEKKVASLEIRYAEGEYPSANALRSNGDIYFWSFLPAVLDDATDDLMLRTAYAEGDNPFFLAMDMNNYPRYWHGYVLILRPFLYFMEYPDFRILNCLAQILLVFFVGIAIWAQTGRKGYVLAFLTSYALLMPLALAFSLQYSWLFYITFGGILFAVYRKDALLQQSNYVYFFLIMGMLIAFFDLLTYPLVAWGFPLIWWIVVSGDSMNGKERIRKIIISGISWAAGYGTFWLLKWIMATPFLGYNVIEDALNEVFYRIGEVDEYAKSILQVYNRWEVLYINWRHYEYGIYSIIITAWMLWGVFHSINSGWKTQLKSGAFLLIGSSSIVWYLVLSNHTSIHHFFTYRIFGVSILGFFCFLLEVIPREDNVKKRTWSKRAAVLSIWGILGVIGLGLSMLAREDITVIYGIDYQEVSIKEGDVLETTFIPTFSYINCIGLCLNAISENGFYRVSVWQDNQELYQIEVPLSNHMTVSYYTENVNWRLKAGKEYQFRITVHDNGDGAYVLITRDGNMPLNEYRDLNINKMEIAGQPLGSFTYHTRIHSHLRLAYTALVWMLCLGGIGSILRQYVRKRLEEADLCLDSLL